MSSPIFAAAQCAVQAGDLNGNLAMHMAFMRQAHEHGVRFLLFPELSLTGYEPSLADGLAQNIDTPLISPLRNVARETCMTTVVGLPLRLAGHEKPLIASFVLHRDGSVTAYTKQHLHVGEEQYFSAGNGGELLSIADVSIALSVCADFSRAEHPSHAAKQGAHLYATSVLIGEAGYPHDSSLLQAYAEEHGMAVLMANHGGPTGGWAAAGLSAFWDEQGHCVASTGGTGNRLLVVSKCLDRWQGFETQVSFTR
ncbi:carbon-nitrogen hydrolase family protein [Pseudomonas sp. SWI6]|uniref:carbon-nitrogen hydrolase family protein n=1 Tax=Pseudomonas TaxID=286 RepID=UPI000CE5D578|nr:MULTISPECIES: carbon-nitrogen hydrolase family protein [Pseudomonas]AVD85573.1 carbon-nitrogen hydrolase family protein [Pseudomonas sp. SWI6]MDT8921721.1 carbon-nitrogen hydrolase family protein [Pseudomonas taiwanensis]